MAGISRSTLLRWFSDGVLEDLSYRDRRGWRLFSKDEVTRIKDEANRVR